MSESGRTAAEYIARAAGYIDTSGLFTLRGYLDYNELEIAADLLFDHSDERPDVPAAFWEELAAAYEMMSLRDRAELCLVRSST